MGRRAYLKRLATKTREERDRSFEVSTVLTKEIDEDLKDEMVELTVSSLLAKIEAGEVSASDLVSAFAQRSAKYGGPQGANAITEQFFDEAATKAEVFSDSEHLKGQLLRGIPISVKDCVGKAGALQTGGLSCRCEEKFRATKDSVIVDVLQRAGAIVLERENNVFGRTLNPWDLSRVPGGSSGGDAALVSMRCVPLALGSDVGGSIRIPAAYCGIIGFKPTADRLSKVGCMLPRPNDSDGIKLAIPSVLGPMARTTDDCARFLKAAWCENHFKQDPIVPPISFKDDVYRDKGMLRIGVFRTDGWFEPCEAAVRAVDELNHIVVPFKPPSTGWETYIMYVGLMGADGNMNGFLKGLDGEALLPTYSKLKQASDIPNFLRPLVVQLLDKRRGTLVKGIRSGGLTARKHINLLTSLMTLRKEWNKAFQEAQVDVLIHPALALPALRHGTSGDLTGAVHLAFLANLLLWPAGTVPVTTVKENEQGYPMDRLPANQRDYWAKRAAETMRGSAGLPVSVAVTAPQFKDELCLRAMNTIETLIKFNAKPKAYLKEQS